MRVLAHSPVSSLLLTLFLPWPNSLAAADFTVPACGELTAWSATVLPRDTSHAVAPKLNLPAAFGPGQFEAVYGVPALALSAGEVTRVRDAMGACAGEAKTRRDGAALASLKTGLGSLAALTRVLVTAQKARDAVAVQKATLDGLPDSVGLIAGVTALAALDPAAPQAAALRGLDPAIARPLAVMAKNFPYLPADEHRRLLEGLSARASAVEAAVVGAMDLEIAAAARDADGLLALLRLEQQAAASGRSEAFQAVSARAAQRFAQLRHALRAASPPAWLPADCAGLYAWSGAPDAREPVLLGPRRSLTLFGDETTAAVFGQALSDWSDQDLARFKTLRLVCRDLRGTLLGSGRRLEAVGAGDPPLLQAARTGYWIDDADAALTDARAAQQAYRLASAALARAGDELASLPDTAEALTRIAQLAREPAQQEVNPDARDGFRAAVETKRAGIVERAVGEALRGMDGLGVASLADLPKLWEYGARVRQSLADPQAVARFHAAYLAEVERTVARLHPEFQARLTQMPPSLQGLEQAWTAVESLSGMPGAGKAPVFAVFRQASFDRAQAMVGEIRAAACKAELARLRLGEDRASTLVWDGKEGVPLGQLACDMADAGGPMNEYSDAGEPTFKSGLGPFGYHTLRMHEAEVAAGKKMLLGFRLKDANTERDLTVQDWTLYVAMAGGGRIVSDSDCATVAGKAEEQMSPSERLLALRCLTERLQRDGQ